MRRSTLQLCLALLAAPLMAVAGQSVNEVRQAAPDAVVEIENVAGSVEVLGWDKNQVEITGTLGNDSDELQIREDGRRISIEVKVEHGHRHIDGSDLKIMVPVASSVMIETVSADISMDQLSGRLELETVSGKVTVDGAPSGLEVATVSGKIEVETTPPNAELATVSGTIEVARAGDEIDAGSVSGEVLIKGGSLSNADLATVSGSVLCEVELSGRGTIEMETMSGNVTLVVPAGTGADFELSTFSGSIHNDLGPAAQRTSKYAPGKEVSFSTGAGPTVRMTSFSGSVKLKTS